MNALPQITSVEDFADYFPLDYPSVLAANEDDITEESPLVDLLIKWCKDRGYAVERGIACDVLNQINADRL